MNNYYKIFNQYVKEYDLKEPMIILKFHHSYRVMEICKDLALYLKLNDEDIELAMLIGLLHDIARFDQWTDYHTFVDRKSFDHGDEGYNILVKDDFIKQFTNDEEKIKIILKAVKNHNKYVIESNLDDRTKLFCKIVKDADKLDISKEQANDIKESEIIIKKELLEDIYNQRMARNEYTSNDVDEIIRIISWVFDYNFKYSYHFLLDQNIIKKKFDLLEMYGETEELEKLKNFIFNEIEKRC